MQEMKKRDIQNTKTQERLAQPAQYRLSSKLALPLHSCSLTVGIPPVRPIAASGLEPGPNPGIDDHRLSLFCCFASAAATASNSTARVVAVAVVGVVAPTTDGLRVLAERLVEVDDPVELGDW